MGRRTARDLAQGQGRRLSGALRLLVAALLAAVLSMVSACAGPVSTARPQGVSTGLARLDAAIRGFDVARARALGQAGATVTAARALDDADAAAARADRAAAAQARRRSRVAVPVARAALAGLPASLRGYRGGAAELAAAARAASSLDDPQRTALASVVQAAASEADAIDAFRVAGQSAWPAYAALDTAQGVWLTRAGAGWYRDATESANAYAVLVQDQRPALDRARILLRRVDVARRPASATVQTSLRAATAALASLRSTGQPGS